MRHALSSSLFAFALFVAAPVLTKGAPPAGAPSATAPAAKCEHGIEKALCARCHPKLAAVFKAKGDWCGEHSRPESQCVPCHPDLAKNGVK